jgi:hypothetical protein
MLATESAEVTAAVLALMGGHATWSVDVHSSELELPAAELISLILQLVSAGMVKSTASATANFDHFLVKQAQQKRRPRLTFARKLFKNLTTTISSGFAVGTTDCRWYGVVSPQGLVRHHQQHTTVR